MKPVDQSLESLNSEVIYFLLYAVFCMLKVFQSHGRLAEYFDLHLILIQQCKMIYTYGFIC